MNEEHSTEIVPRQNSTVARNTVKSLLQSDAYKARFQEVLGDTAPQFLASLASLASNSNLAQCDPKSVIASAFVAASLDLPIDKNLGFAHIVPYAGMAQFQMGYKGFVQLAQRSGSYKSMTAVAVPEGVFVSFDRLQGELILDWKQKKSEAIVGYAASFRLLNGFGAVDYWTREEVEKHAAKFSQAFKKKKMDSPWFTNFDAMALKTVVKSLLSHWGPLSVALRKAVAHDSGTIVDIDSEPLFNDGDSDDEAPKELPASGVQRLADKLAPKPKEDDGAKGYAARPDEKTALNSADQLGVLIHESGLTFADFAPTLNRSGLCSRGAKSVDDLTDERAAKAVSDFAEILAVVKSEKAP